MKRSPLPRAMMLVALPLARALAQDPAASRRATMAPSERPIVPCAGQRIDEITVYSEAPTVANLRRVPLVAQLARALHTTTRPQVIRHFLLLEEGNRCSELRRAESERILRAQPYIADADVFVVENDHGGVDLEVRTSDEASIVLGGAPRFTSPFLGFLLLGSANVAGQGVYVAGDWREGRGFRDGFSGRLIDYQFQGKPLIVAIEGDRASLGGSWRAEARRPYFTDLQRLAWRGQVGGSEGYTELRLPNGDRPAVQVRRQFFDLGVLGRLGPPGHLSLFGVSVTHTGLESGDRLIMGDQGIITDVGPLDRTYASHRVTRLNGLFGYRRLSFERRDGLDALTATQDVPVGLQIGALVGRSAPFLSSRDIDTFVSGDLYLGGTSQYGVSRLQLRGEARHPLGLPWDGILTSGRYTHSMQPSRWRLEQFELEWANVFRQRTPFQLLLGVPEGGIRGYEQSTLAGGQRVVARFEERYLLGTALKQGDVGMALFADVGKQWAGSVPFGVRTPVLGSLGISLIAAVPPRSARQYRVDLAFPLSQRLAGRGWTVTFTNADRAKFAFRESRDVADAREPTVPSSIFAFP